MVYLSTAAKSHEAAFRFRHQATNARRSLARLSQAASAETCRPHDCPPTEGKEPDDPLFFPENGRLFRLLSGHVGR